MNSSIITPTGNLFTESHVLFPEFGDVVADSL